MTLLKVFYKKFEEVSRAYANPVRIKCAVTRHYYVGVYLLAITTMRIFSQLIYITQTQSAE